MAFGAIPKADAANLGLLVDVQGRRHGDRVLAAFPQGEMSFATLRDRCRALAKAMIASGIRPGDHVAMFMPNGMDFLVGYFAIMMTGAMAVPVNARLKRQDLAYALTHSDARLVLTTDVIDDHVDLVGLLCEAVPELSRRATAASGNTTRLEAIVLLGNTRRAEAIHADDFLPQGAAVSDAALDAVIAMPRRSDLALMIYSSGTTGAPKGCRLSHAALLDKWTDYSDIVSLDVGDALWIPLPFFHIGGIGPIVAALLCGASFVSAPHVDVDVALDLIRRWRAQHWYPGLLSITQDTLKARGYDREQLAFVKTVVCVGPTEMLQAVEDALPPAAKLLNLFGMTEGCGPITFTPVDAAVEDRVATEGPAMAGVEVRITDLEDGRALVPGTGGEIQYRGRGSFTDYYKNETATRSTLLPGGWIRSGDFGRLLPGGQLRYMGRAKDMLRVGGENVSAVEVEGFLGTHPAVKLAQIVGRPDARLGEVPVAFVELAPGKACSAEDLIAFCNGEIASFKVPRDVLFVTEWPMSSTKIQKMKLRERLLERPVEPGPTASRAGR